MSQLRDPLVLVLLAAAGFTLATADFTDASVILFVVVANTIVGVVQEAKAERAITALLRRERVMCLDVNPLRDKAVDTGD